MRIFSMSVNRRDELFSTQFSLGTRVFWLLLLSCLPSTLAKWKSRVWTILSTLQLPSTSQVLCWPLSLSPPILWMTMWMHTQLWWGLDSYLEPQWFWPLFLHQEWVYSLATRFTSFPIPWIDGRTVQGSWRRQNNDRHELHPQPWEWKRGHRAETEDQWAGKEP